jgi:hypothetical protein
MTKFQLIQKIMERSNSLSQQDAKTIVNTVFTAMTNALARGERIGKELKERVDTEDQEPSPPQT